MNTEKLRSLIRESINEYIKEIDEAGTVAMYEAKIAKTMEAIEMRETKLEKLKSLEEAADMLDEAKIKMMEKEINELKKYATKLKKQKEKAANKGKKKEVVADAKIEDAPVDEADVTAEMNMSDDGMKDEALNESFLKMQKIAGLITEAQYRQKKSLVKENVLSSNEQNIVDDILGENIEEGVFNLDKLKSYAKKGVLTLGIIAALLGGSKLTNSQKEDVVNIIKTEKTVDQDVKDMSQAQLALSLYKSHKKDTDITSKIDSNLIKQLDDLINKKQENDVNQLEIVGKTYRQDIQDFINNMTTTRY